MFNVYKNQQSRQTGSRNPMDSLSNYWWQESDIWSQASYRYAILWEVFLDPSDSYFLFADLVGFYTHWRERGYKNVWPNFAHKWPY
jgi:hypothetical protein